MKPTKHILKLSTKINTNKYITDNCLAEQLMNIRYALLAGRFYGGASNVNATNTTRSIQLAYIKDNKMHWILNDDIKKLADIPKTGRVAGCGMDMIYHSQYNLFATLCPKHNHQDSMLSYHSLNPQGM